MLQAEIQRQYQQKEHTLEECLALIESGDTIAVSGVATEPTTFLSHFIDIVPRLHDVTVVKSKDNEYEYLRDPATRGHVETIGHFYAKNMREGHALGIASYIPSDLHNYMAERVAYQPNNVFVAQVADLEDGVFQIPYCKMFEEEAYGCAQKVILEVNPRFRRVRGGLEIPLERVTAFFRSEKPLFTIPRSVPTETDRKIGHYVADLIHDGDCIQLGIGGLPDAVGGFLQEKNDLGIHTEVFTSTMADLIQAGNVTGKRKNLNPGEHIATFCLGDEQLYETVATDPNCRIVPCSYGNNPFVIAQNDHMISVNTAIEVDITGQICSESIGPRQFSGTGGATDYAFGAMHSKGGRGIVAFASTAKEGRVSKIKSILTPGAAVSISRNLADTIITEFGVAELRGRTIRERVDALIAIAHPDFRAQLRREAKEYGIIV
jgi:acyl-CoA hydrolase